MPVHRVCSIGANHIILIVSSKVWVFQRLYYTQSVFSQLYFNPIWMVSLDAFVQLLWIATDQYG